MVRDFVPPIWRGRVEWANPGLLALSSTSESLDEAGELLSTVQSIVEAKPQPIRRIVRRRHAPRLDAARFRQTLAKRVSIQFDETPLSAVAERFEMLIGHPTWLDCASLHEQGIQESETVSLKLDDVPLANALRMALQPWGLTFLVDEDSIRITTNIAAAELGYTVVYDLRDFAARQLADNDVINLIVNTTSGPWLEVDGTGSPIAFPLPGILVVHQTNDVHREVHDLIDDLRQGSQAIMDRRQKAGRESEPDPIITEVAAVTVDPPQAIAAVKHFVHPESWEGQGGDGEIMPVGKTLIIRHRAQVVKETLRFLEQIESQSPNPPRER